MFPGKPMGILLRGEYFMVYVIKTAAEHRLNPGVRPAVIYTKRNFYLYGLFALFIA